MPAFFERPKIGRPVAVALGAVLVLALLAVALLLAYWAGADDGQNGQDDAADDNVSDTGTGLPGADEVYDPLQTVEGASYDPELYIFRGYEHSYIGAVSAAADWVAAQGGSLDPDYSEQLGTALLADTAEQAPADWRSWPENRREDLGLATSGAVLDGYDLAATPMAYQTHVTSDTEIEVILLVRLTGTSPYGSTSANTVLSMDLLWTGSDWIDAGYDTGVDHSDLEVDIGDENSNLATTLGWHQLVN